MSSQARLGLHQVLGLVFYTLHESVRRWTLVTFLIGITFFLLLLTTAVNLDIVEGTLASARLFGQEVELGDMGIRITDVVRTFQVAVISLLYIVGLALALLLTSNSVPTIAREGWVDLLVAQPIARPTLLLGRTLGSFIVVTIGIAYLVIGSWIILRWKTGFGNAGFLAAGAIILFAYFVCYSATVLVGIVTRNAPVAGFAGLFVWVAGHILYPFHNFPEWRAALSAGWPRQLAVGITESLYWIFPKNQGLGQAAVAAAGGETFSLTPVWLSLPFAVGSLFVACWWFARRDY